MRCVALPLLRRVLAQQGQLAGGEDGEAVGERVRRPCVVGGVGARVSGSKVPGFSLA